MLDTISRWYGKPDYSSWIDAQHRVASVEVTRDGPATPRGALPDDYGWLFFVDDTRARAAPGPDFYEHKMLHNLTFAADTIILQTLYSNPDGSFHPSDEVRGSTLVLIEITTMLFEGRTVLFVATPWDWLEPWESYLHQHRRKGAKVFTLGRSGLRTITFWRPGDMVTDEVEAGGGE